MVKDGEDTFIALTTTVFCGLIPNLPKFCLRVIPILVRQLIECLTACQLIKTWLKLFCYSQDIRLVPSKLVRHKKGGIFISKMKSPGTGEFPAQRPVTRSFDVFFDRHPNERLCKQSWGWWFETPSCPLWRHRNGQWRCLQMVRTSLGFYLDILSYFLWYFRSRFCSLCLRFYQTTICIFAIISIERGSISSGWF